VLNSGKENRCISIVDIHYFFYFFFEQHEPHDYYRCYEKHSRAVYWAGEDLSFFFETLQVISKSLHMTYGGFLGKLWMSFYPPYIFFSFHRRCLELDFTDIEKENINRQFFLFRSRGLSKSQFGGPKYFFDL